MRERPILFSGTMVRAIIEGRKTVTRRVVKPQPDFLGSMTDPTTPFKTLGAGLHWQIVCPYGQPGDRLWVRETFAQWIAPEVVSGRPCPMTAYRAGRQWRNGNRADRAPGEVCWEEDSKPQSVKWKPSIHMPRATSRILLEITAVRVERLQDITEQQALAEGVASCEQDLDPDGNCYSPVELFSILWSSINGTDSWNANPWVWVVEFKRVEVANA